LLLISERKRSSRNCDLGTSSTISFQPKTLVHGSLYRWICDPCSEEELEGVSPLAQKAGKVRRDHSALEFRECVGDDLNIKMGLPFPRGIKTRPGETVLFSYIVYKSRAHRDRINARVMKDPHLAKMMDPKGIPFDVKRMMYGGFKTIVEA
jgi:uncharacterized protein YbaA (DUF1428 family)